MALESLDRFASDTMGKSYGNFNGGFVGECVSYVQQYMIRCLGISPSGWGNAVDYWTNPNPNFAKHFTRIGADKPMQDGDIIVWQQDARTGVTHYGHIAIAYQGRVLQQNWSGRYVSLNNMFMPGLLGYWRPIKGGGKMSNITKEQENQMSVIATGAFPGKDYDYRFTGKESNQETLDGMLQHWTKVSSDAGLLKQLSAEQKKSVGLVKNVGDLTAKLKDAKDQLAAFESETNEPDLIAKAQAEIDRLEAELAAAEKKIKLLEADKLKPTQPVDPVAPDNSTPENSTQTPTLSEVLSVIRRWLVSFIKRN